MVEKNGDTLLIQCEDDTPLIHGLDARCDYATLDLLIDSNKDVLQIRGCMGMLPLSIGLQYKRDIDVIKLLLDKNNTDLVDLSGLPRHVEYKPNLIPLHIAIKQKLSLEIITFLVNINPSMLRLTDALDRTALHLWEFLARCGPDAKTKGNLHYEDTPMRCALRYIWATKKTRSDEFIPIFTKFLQILIDTNEEVLTMKDDVGKTPLQNCMDRMIYLPQYLRVLVGKQKTAILRTKNTDQNTPLHHFLCHGWREWKETCYIDDLIGCLDVLSQDSAVFTMHNKFRQFPLHLATRVTKEESVFMKLINYNVQTLMARDEFNDSALDMLLSRKHLCIHMLTYIHMYICVYMYICIYIYIYICI